MSMDPITPEQMDLLRDQLLQKNVETPADSRPVTKTFVDNLGRPVNPDEVKPVKPIELDTPGQLLEKARKEVADLKAQVSALEAKHAEAVADAKTAVDLAARAARDVVAKNERIAEISTDRETWKRRTIAAEAQPKPEHVANIVADRDRMRGEVASKDKRIADLAKQLAQAETHAGHAHGQAQKAEQRIQHVQATIESMQIARDAAQQRQAAAELKAHQLEEKLKLEMAASDEMKTQITKLHAQISDLKPKAVAAPAPVKKGA